MTSPVTFVWSRLTKPAPCAHRRQISMGIHPVWSESSLCPIWVAKDPFLLQADSEDWSEWAAAQIHLTAFAGCTGHFVCSVVLWLIWSLPRTDKTKWSPHDKTNQMACAPSKDQRGHPPSLIRVFAVRMKKAWVLSYPLSAQRRLIRLDGCLGWSESLLGAQSFCWFCHEAAQMFAWQSRVGATSSVLSWCISRNTQVIFMQISKNLYLMRRLIWIVAVLMPFGRIYCTLAQIIHSFYPDHQSW